jgi:hypothetical protein
MLFKDYQNQHHGTFIEYMVIIADHFRNTCLFKKKENQG